MDCTVNLKENETASRSRQEVKVETIAELATLMGEDGLQKVRDLYDISIADSPPIEMNERAWADTHRILRIPREDVEEQKIISVYNRTLFNEALINPIRRRRIAPPSGPKATDLIEQERAINGCRFCDKGECGWHVKHLGLWKEKGIDDVRSGDGRIGAWANFARQAQINALVIGDEKTHSHLDLGLSDWTASFVLGEEYIKRARKQNREARFFMIIMNAGIKSASTVPHSHLQVVGRESRHFAYPEFIANVGPKDYWLRAAAIHEELGLAGRKGECLFWANICPTKENDICAISPTLHAGAELMHALLETLKKEGTNSWSLAAILSPRYVTGCDSDERFSGWPNVVWRLVDRGDIRARHSDWGCLELFGSSVVATDPIVLGRLLKSRLG